MFRTACLVAALALCAATAPPRISLELTSTHSSFGPNRNGFAAKGTTATIDEDYAQECEANKQGYNSKTETCLFPEAKAYDAQDQDLTDDVTVAIRLLDNDEVEVNMDVPGSPFTNAQAPSTASAFNNPINNKPASETPSTYLFEYDVRDSAGNEAEKVTFALVLNDVTAPAITWGNKRFGATGQTGQPAAQSTIEYGTGLPFQGVTGVGCDDNVYNGLTPTISFTNVPSTTQNAGCAQNMNTDHAFEKCAAFSSDYIDFDADYASDGSSKKRATMHVRCEDHASIYGASGQNNFNTYDVEFKFEDTTPPRIVTQSASETHECSTAADKVQAWNTTVCYDDALQPKWHHDHTEVTVTRTNAQTCDQTKINIGECTSWDSDNINCLTNKAYDNTCNIEYLCKDKALNEATPEVRQYKVEDTTPPVMNIDYTTSLAGVNNAADTRKCSTHLPLSEQKACKLIAADDAGNSLVHQIHPRDADNTVILSKCNKLHKLGGECVQKLQGSLAHWRCDSSSSKCTFEEDMSNGDGTYGLKNGALSKVMGVTDTCDSAEDLRFFGEWKTDSGYTAFDASKVGTYKREYTIADKSGNQVSAQILITLQDPDAPIIQMIGCEATTADGSCQDHVEYTYDNEVYKDFGATCHDYVDGSLSHAVEVSGEVVDLKKPKTYQINYNCQDLSGNAATAVTRYVVVEDKTPPVISINGEEQNFVEAGFPYEDAGACYSDQLDGQCCLETGAAHHAPNSGANVNSVGCPANVKDTSGIWKDAVITTGTGGTNAFLTSLKTDTSQTAAKRSALTQQNDRAIGGTGGAELEYKITYDAIDFNGNHAAEVYRTIFVRDTLPPVITLHPVTSSGTFGTPKTAPLASSRYNNAAVQAKLGSTRMNNLYENPATYAQNSKSEFKYESTHLGTDVDNVGTTASFNINSFGNPNLKLMAETSSVNGWLIAAVASAVAGVALLSFSAKSSNQVMVPV